jgi:NADPH2:quinone reductase
VPLVSASGADYIIVSSQTDFAEATLHLTNQQGVHVVYDGVGGPEFEKNLCVLRTRGDLVLFGMASGQPMPLDISRLSGITGTNNRGSLFVTFASTGNGYITTVEQLRAYAAELFDEIIQERLRLRIAEVFPLEQAAQAHRLLESKAASGKLLLRVT